MVSYVVIYWIVAVATATFAAVNERELRRRRYDVEALRRFALALEESAPRTRSRTAAHRGGRRPRLERWCSSRSATGDRGGRAVRRRRGRGRRGRPAARGHGPPADRGPGHRAPARSVSPSRAASWPMLAGRAQPRARAAARRGQARRRARLRARPLKRDSRIERRVISTLERYTSPTALALVNAWLLEQLRAHRDDRRAHRTANRRAFDPALEREIPRPADGGSRVDRRMLTSTTSSASTTPTATPRRRRPARVARGAQAVVRPSTRRALRRRGVRPDPPDLSAADARGGRRASAAADRRRRDRGAGHRELRGLDLDAERLHPVALVESADGALRRSKAGGRNMVTTAD